MSIEGTLLSEEDLSFTRFHFPIGTERTVFISANPKDDGVVKKPKEPRTMKVVGEDAITLTHTNGDEETTVELQGVEISYTGLSLKPFKTKVNFMGSVYCQSPEEIT